MMMSMMPKSGSLAQLCKVTSYPMTSAIIPPVTSHQKTKLAGQDKEIVPFTNPGFHRKEVTGLVVATSVPSVFGKVQYRLAHTDHAPPDFTFYRRPSTKDATKKAQESAAARKVFTYTWTTVATTTCGLIIAKDLVNKVCFYLWIKQDDMAMGRTEIDLSTVPEGKSVTFVYRGKPLFVKHRSDEEAERERNTDLSVLVDAQKDEDRVKHPNWLVTIGICTHLGCIPIPNAGDYPGGYFCPCHGSHYDGSGRIRKGPAPLNLEVPPYMIQNNMLIVGD